MTAQTLAEWAAAHPLARIEDSGETARVYIGRLDDEADALFSLRSHAVVAALSGPSYLLRRRAD